MMINILVSACLMGINCRYDGKNCYYRKIEKLKETANLIPICPEQLGGLPTPRQPSEIRGTAVVRKDGEDLTAQYREGADKALEAAKAYGCEFALLKSKSPSCGKETVYDGTFTGKLTEGNGVTVKRLETEGITVFNENEIDLLISKIKQE